MFNHQKGLVLIITVVIVATFIAGAGYLAVSQSDLLKVLPKPILQPTSVSIPTATLTPRPKVTLNSSFVPSPILNQLPSLGYSRKVVKTDAGSFNVDIISADLNTTKVILDSSEDVGCHPINNPCKPVSLAQHAQRSGAYAGINGGFIGETDIELNRNKHFLHWRRRDYFEANSECGWTKVQLTSGEIRLQDKHCQPQEGEQYIYGGNEVFVFGPGTSYFLGELKNWPVTYSVDSVIHSYPILIKDGHPAPCTNRGDRRLKTFLGTAEDKVYMGVIYNADDCDFLKNLNALGIQNALQLDAGSSTAFWYQGRDILGQGNILGDVILFVRR